MTTNTPMPSLVFILFVKLLVFHFSMGVGVQSKTATNQDLSEATKLVEEWIAKDDIVIFSKTYCPYCKVTKDIFNSLDRKYTVIELDERKDGSAIQTVLGLKTGVKTVPRVFIKGQCVGGSTEIKAFLESGFLLYMLDNN